MKYNETTPYFQIPRSSFHDNGQPAEINSLSLPAFKLYVWLKELEHRYTNSRESRLGKSQKDFFWHSDKMLVETTGLSHGAVSRAKKELQDCGFINITQRHFKQENGTLSWKHVSVYELLK